jgi:predicted regulator of Ras-like GTPase activity (Roadblock/LC7/MglB family)
MMNLAEARGKARQSSNTDQFIRSGTDFLKRYATPNDIVAKAASLDGVLGALITLPDGLLVASHLPANMNGDALAAFTPQIYVRVTQSAREYRMGDLKELTFTVGNTQWKIYKVGSIFFAAFGKSDELLPVKELTTLAAELDRKPKAQV